MTAAEVTVWRATRWCEARGITACERLRFGHWFATTVADVDPAYPMGAAYALWQQEGRS